MKSKKAATKNAQDIAVDVNSYFGNFPKFLDKLIIPGKPGIMDKNSKEEVQKLEVVGVKFDAKTGEFSGEVSGRQVSGVLAFSVLEALLSWALPEEGNLKAIEGLLRFTAGRYILFGGGKSFLWGVGRRRKNPLQFRSKMLSESRYFTTKNI